MKLSQSALNTARTAEEVVNVITDACIAEDIETPYWTINEGSLYVYPYSDKQRGEPCTLHSEQIEAGEAGEAKAALETMIEMANLSQ